MSVLSNQGLPAFLHSAPSCREEALFQMQQGWNTTVQSPWPQLVCRKKTPSWERQTKKIRDPPYPAKHLEQWLRDFAWRKRKSIRTESSGTLPERLTLFESGCGQVQDSVCSHIYTEILVEAFKRKLVAIWKQQAKTRPASLQERTRLIDSYKDPSEGIEQISKSGLKNTPYSNSVGWDYEAAYAPGHSWK